MKFLFLDRVTRELRELAEPTEVHDGLMEFAAEHPSAEYIVRGKPEGNYILVVL